MIREGRERQRAGLVSIPEKWGFIRGELSGWKSNLISWSITRRGNNHVWVELVFDKRLEKIEQKGGVANKA